MLAQTQNSSWASGIKDVLDSGNQSLGIVYTDISLLFWGELSGTRGSIAENDGSELSVIKSAVFISVVELVEFSQLLKKKVHKGNIICLYVFSENLDTDLFNSLDEFVEFDSSGVVKVEESEVLEKDGFFTLEGCGFLEELSSDFFLEASFMLTISQGKE